MRLYFWIELDQEVRLNFQHIGDPKRMAKAKAEAEEYGFKDRETFREYLEERKAEIAFVHGSGHRKSEAQKQWEAQDKICTNWEKYAEQLEIMGDGRNSYSKTDPDATFMKLKEDHMKNGQLKPAYNLQLAVNSEYITGCELFSDRSDVKTLRPFLKEMETQQRRRYEEVVADAGYESLENYLYLEANGQTCFIKPTNYDSKKTKKFKAQIGRLENMGYDAEEDSYICAEGRRLPLRRESSQLMEGQWVSTAWYRCESCAGCPRRAECCRAKDPDQPKELCVKRTFWEKREQATENITSPKGIQLRMCRSIQAEGAFALLKNDFGFRRFITWGRENVRTEMFLYAFAFNVKKYWMKRKHGRLQTRVSEKMTA